MKNGFFRDLKIKLDKHKIRTYEVRMKYVILLSWTLIAVLSLVLSSSGNAVNHQQKSPAQQAVEQRDEKPAPAAAVPVYKPPIRGAPGGRVGGGTRGPGREVFVLSVLAPDHTGLTVNEQPSFYWFISSPTSSPLEFTLMDHRATKPVLETRLPSPVQPGVHRIRLADHGVRLSPGVPYRWFVAVVPDPDRRSRDILAAGAIERIEVPQGLSVKLAQAGKAKAPHIYAEAGLWYDALGALSELIETAPHDAVLRRQRASLLKQVGLPGIGE